MPVCRYHRLHPEYIVSRMKEILRSFRLRVVLCHVDVEDPKEPLGQVNKLAALNGFTLLCGFSQKVRPAFLHASYPQMVLLELPGGSAVEGWGSQHVGRAQQAMLLCGMSQEATTCLASGLIAGWFMLLGERRGRGHTEGGQHW